MRSKELSLSLAEQPLESAQFDRAILPFWNGGQEAIPLEAMQAINTGDFAFVQISHICYERERDCSDKNLLDFQQILSAAANIGGRGQFAYLIDSDGQNLKLYLGVCQQSSTHSTQAHDIDNAVFLRNTFEGIYKE